VRELTRWESATFGGLLHEEVDMVLGSVELGRGRVEVRGHVCPDVLAPVEHFRVEHATATLGGEHQVDVQVAGGAATTPLGVWFPQGCRWPRLRCGP